MAIESRCADCNREVLGHEAILEADRHTFLCLACWATYPTPGFHLRDEDSLTLSAYAAEASQTAVYPGAGTGRLDYVAFALAEEVGEVLGHIAKANRDDGGKFKPKRRAALLKELGDVLWQWAALCRELGFPPEAVARVNLLKLADRQDRGVLHGEGDER